MEDRHERLVRMVRERAGPAFRVAIRYTDDDWAVLFVRDDVASDSFRESVGRTVERARAYAPISHPEFYSPLGDFEATVEQYDEAVIIHFREDGGGLLLSLDREVAQGLGSFIAECTAVLDGSTA